MLVPPRSVRPLPEAELVALPTQRLMACRERLLQLEESAAFSDWDEGELADLDPTSLHFKDDPAWSKLYGLVTGILSERKHVPRATKHDRRHG